MKTLNIGISAENLRSVVEILNRLLADEIVLAMKTRNYHWNVAGPHFHDLHKFFESQYEELEEKIDDVAERARALGGRAVGTLGEHLKNARLKEIAATGFDAQAMIADLLSAHEALVRALREDVEAANNRYQDVGTGDFLTGIMEGHEKMAWMLRASLRD